MLISWCGEGGHGERAARLVEALVASFVGGPDVAVEVLAEVGEGGDYR